MDRSGHPWHEQFDTLRIDGQPDTNFEYYLYQTLVGAWPLSRERAHTHAEKAAREAKVFTDWRRHHRNTSRQCTTSSTDSYDDTRFIGEVEAFVDSLHPGDWHKALAQLLLKMTMPGVPDFYQGVSGGSWPSAIPITGVRWTTSLFRRRWSRSTISRPRRLRRGSTRGCPSCGSRDAPSS